MCGNRTGEVSQGASAPSGWALHLKKNGVLEKRSLRWAQKRRHKQTSGVVVQRILATLGGVQKWLHVDGTTVSHLCSNVVFLWDSERRQSTRAVVRAP